MPVPVFIVCSEGGSIDRHTNLVSIFDVIERFTFAKLEQPIAADAPGLDQKQRELIVSGKPASLVSMRIIAVWKRSIGDEDREFDFKTTVLMPGAQEEVAGQGRIVFKTPLHRILSNYYCDMPLQSGEILVKSSIKRVEDSQWLSQEYVIPVERIEVGANQRTLPLS